MDQDDADFLDGLDKLSGQELYEQIEVVERVREELMEACN